VLWDQGVQTDRELLANRPDIIVKNKDRTRLLIDVAVPSDRNVIQKEAEGIVSKSLENIWKQYQDNIQ
jgi:spermidine/putrescine-binding protein